MYCGRWIIRGGDARANADRRIQQPLRSDAYSFTNGHTRRPAGGPRDWQGSPPQPHSGQQLPITLTLKLGTTEVNYPVETTDASGFFTVSVESLPPGLYEWRAKGRKYMANSGAVQLDGSNRRSNVRTFKRSNVLTTVEMGIMRAGDGNNDNLVNSADFNIMRNTFGLTLGDVGYDERGDFNNDDIVNAGDFNMLRQNFGGGGSEPLGVSGP